ncbi:MAG: hypothetical protein AVDCRST_MAG90-81, partial [uncultured Microvirga sp.]
WRRSSVTCAAPLPTARCASWATRRRRIRLRFMSARSSSASCPSMTRTATAPSISRWRSWIPISRT